MGYISYYFNINYLLIIFEFYNKNRILNLNYLFDLGIGDWGLGIAQSPIPNPQSPIKL